mgnify:CR=1 FL=1
MVDSTIIDEVKDMVKKTRGRPKKIKTPEEIEEDRLKKNNYHSNYHKMRCLNDEIYVDKCRMQTKERVKRYTEKNKDLLKIKRDEIVKKAKLYDEIVKSIV